MGSQVSTATSQTGTISSYLADFPDYQYESSLESTRFLKVIRAKSEQGTVVVKIFIKIDPSLFYKKYIKQMEDVKTQLAGVHNVMPFVHVGESERAVIAVRPYLFHNLYDRISTRPFLSSMERRWLAYQLLYALKKSHELGVCHGDVRAENVLITSWHWLQLADYASFKPTFLPEDNPAAFAFFFDTSMRRVCYVAPERFYNPAKSKQEIADAMVSETDEYREGRLLPPMDVFSAGCVIAELLLDGNPLFTFAQLLAYRNGEYDPTPTLDRIEDPHFRDLVKHMTQRDPEKRLSADEYLIQWRDRAFPSNFYTFLHDFCGLHAKGFTPDEKIAHIRYHWPDIITALCDTEQTPHELRGKRASLGLPSSLKRSKEVRAVTSALSAVALASLSSPRPDRSTPPQIAQAAQHTPSPEKEGSMVVISLLVTSHMRGARLPSSKVGALELLCFMAPHLTDWARLDRLVPYAVAMLHDDIPLVRACAVRTIARLLETVTRVPPSEANIFPEYILPSLAHIAGENGDKEVMVRVAYAENMATLAETALRFLESGQLGEEGGEEDEVYNAGYDTELLELQERIQEEVVKMLGERGETQTVVKCALLGDMTRLCIFFGRQKANDVLLSHMACYLNEPDWRLRRALFDGVVGVGLYVGGQSLEQYILPLLEEGLTDAEESVSEKALYALACLAELALFRKKSLWRLTDLIAPLLIHPSIWIRFEAVGFVSSVAKVVSLAENHCNLLPAIQPFLKHSLMEIRDEPVFLEALTSPVPRDVYDRLLTVEDQETAWQWLELRQRCRQEKMALPQVPKVLVGARGDGMDEKRLHALTGEDELKLLALRLFMVRVARKRKSLAMKSTGDRPPKSRIIKLATMRDVTVKHADLTPQRADRTSANDLNSPHVRAGTGLGVSSPREQRGRQQSSPQTTVRTGSIEDASLTRVVRLDSAISSVSLPRASSDVNLLTPMQSGSFYYYAPEDEPALAAPPVSKEVSTGSCRADIRVGASLDLGRLIRKKQRAVFPPTRSDMGLLAPAQSGPVRRDVSATGSKGQPRKQSKSSWRPEGILLANLLEHKGAVNRIVVAPDSKFFATASDDGTIKIWDSQRIVSNFAVRSSQTYARQGGRIRGLALCEHSTSLATASDNGSIHVVRVDVESLEEGKHRYLGVGAVFTKQVDEADEGQVLDLHHYNTQDGQSLLVYSTVRGHIYAYDLRCNGPAWKLKSDPAWGSLSAFAIDSTRSWLVGGTSRGVMAVWDVRFNVSSLSWLLPDRYPVSRLTRSDYFPESHMVVAAGPQVMVWDVEDRKCTNLLRPWVEGNPADMEVPDMAAKPISRSYEVASDELSKRHAIKGTLYGLHCPAETPYVFTGGSDRALRLWNLASPSHSLCLSGPNNRPPTKYRWEDARGMMVVTEFLDDSNDPLPLQQSASQILRGPTPPPTNHFDRITDIACADVGQHRLVVSASREGVVKVFK